MKVKDIIDFHEKHYNKDLSIRRKQLTTILELDENKYIDDLSLGNKKKVGIILSLLHEPDLLILDEPTSSLDPIMQNKFYNLLSEEKNRGTTILYSTHILNEVTRICDRVGFIKDGKIIKEDNVKNIINNNSKNISIESDEIDSIIKELELKEFNKNGNLINFINKSNINHIIEKLSNYNIDNLLIEDVTLEDIFISYYK